jgi:hypothetical protein
MSATDHTNPASYRANGPQDFAPTPLQRLGIWLATNANLDDNFSDADATLVIERLNACGIGEDIEQLSFSTAAVNDDEVLCEDCGAIVVEDASPGVWVHDPGSLGDTAYDLNEDHAARPPKDLA